MNRRAFLASAALLGLSTRTTELDAAPSPPVRFKWPWPVRAPDPHALGDPCAALLAATLFPPLYVRAVDGMLEPKGALAGPKEIKNGLRVDLVPGLRPSDVLGSLAAAKSRGGRLALRDVPVPRVEGEQSVVFPGFLDPDALMRRLATPLAGVARIEPRRLLPTGGWDLAVKERESTSVLELTRRPTTPAVGVQPGGLPRIARFELEGVVDLARSLRTFERFESELSYLADGLFAPRPGARAMDLGALAFVGLRAGTEVPELRVPGAVQRILESLPADRFGHLGLLRRGHVAAEPLAGAPDAATLAPNVAVVARVSQPMLVGAAEILARELGGIARVLDDATFARVEAEGRFPLLLDVVRPIDDTAEGAAIALATFAGANVPKAGATPSSVGKEGSAVLGWELALLGAQASHVWIPRAPFGGLDLAVGAVG